MYARVIFGDSGKSGNASTNTAFVQKILHITAQKRKPNVQHHSQADDLGLVLKYLNGECFATHARDKPIRLLEPSLILTVPEVHWAERS